MGNVATISGVTGFYVRPVPDASGTTTWHWRAYHNHAAEENVADSYEEATEACREAHERLSGGH